MSFRTLVLKFESWEFCVRHLEIKSSQMCCRKCFQVGDATNLSEA